jgi:hypothetical protein
MFITENTDNARSFLQFSLATVHVVALCMNTNAVGMPLTKTVYLASLRSIGDMLNLTLFVGDSRRLWAVNEMEGGGPPKSEVAEHLKMK